MTKQSENFDLTNLSNADSTSDGVQLSALSQADGTYTPEQQALFAKNQNDLVDRRVIPHVEIENEGSNTGVKSDWASARVEARLESERNISQGKHIHHIRYGDTLWDVASASFNKNNGHKPNNSEIMGEVHRLAKKNNVINMNNIPIGTAIDTAPDRANGGMQTNDRRQERFSQSALDQPQNRIPNYYDFTGDARRYSPNPIDRQLNPSTNYYEFNGGPSRRNEVRLPNLTDRQPDLSYRQPNSTDRQPNSTYRAPNTTDRQPIATDRRPQDVPLTPETWRELLQDRGDGRTLGPRNINPGMEITPRAKNTTTWRNAHNDLQAKARRGAPSVAFYGDSITQGLQLNPGFKAAFGGSENFGIGGDTNENLLYRLRDGEANFSGSKPDTAVLLIGTNNIGSQKPDKIAAGILANAKELSNRLPGTEIVVMGILPRGYSANDSLRHQVNAVNDILRRQLNGVAGVKFVDIGPQLLDRNGNMSGGIFNRDNVHLTYNTGYSAMLRALQPHVRTRR